MVECSSIGEVELFWWGGVVLVACDGGVMVECSSFGGVEL